MSEVTVIAELCANHHGSIEVASRMINVAASYCNVDVVKFQKRTIDLIPEEKLNRPYSGRHSYGDTYRKHREALEFNLEEHKHLKALCEMNNVKYSCSVWDIRATQEIASLNPSMIKIPSACNTRFDMLEWLVKNYSGEIHLPMGMTTAEEKNKIYDFITNNATGTFVIYDCVSEYPAKFKNLAIIDILRYVDWCNCGIIKGVGLSGHHLGIAVEPAALALGAWYFERHFTLDRTQKGTDQAASLEPDGMRKLVRDLRSVVQSLKRSDHGLKECEKEAREKLKG